jgi:hypothetical protein
MNLLISGKIYRGSRINMLKERKEGALIQEKRVNKTA